MGVDAYYMDTYFPWYYTLDFETGIYKCDNGYGVHEYQLDRKKLIKFEQEIIGSHALDWEQDDIGQGLDGRCWSLSLCFADGTVKKIQGMDSYKYNYLRLEHVFISTEQTLRGGRLYSIDYITRIPPGEYVGLEEAKKKYPDEFPTIRNSNRKEMKEDQ